MTSKIQITKGGRPPNEYNSKNEDHPKNEDKSKKMVNRKKKETPKMWMTKK